MPAFSTLIAIRVLRIITTINKEQGESCSLLVVSETVNESLTIDLAQELMQTHSMPMILVIDPKAYETVNVRDYYMAYLVQLADGVLKYLYAFS